MTRYYRKLKITSTSGTVHEVYAISTSDRPARAQALRKHGWQWVTSRYLRTRSDLRNAVDVPHPIAIGRRVALTEYVARRVGIVIQKGEEPAWMTSATS